MNDGAQGAIQEASMNHEFHKVPLEGIGGPMTRSRAKRMKHALHGLLVQKYKRMKLPGFEQVWRPSHQGNDQEFRPSHEGQSGHKSLIEDLDG